jgi:hypothetical protein
MKVPDAKMALSISSKIHPKVPPTEIVSIFHLTDGGATDSSKSVKKPNQFF